MRSGMWMCKTYAGLLDVRLWRVFVLLSPRSKSAHVLWCRGHITPSPGFTLSLRPLHASRYTAMFDLS